MHCRENAVVAKTDNASHIKGVVFHVGGHTCYDQAPTASNFLNDVNVERTVRFCSKHIVAKRLSGFLVVAWMPTVEVRRQAHTDVIEQAGRALAKSLSE